MCRFTNGPDWCTLSMAFCLAAALSYLSFDRTRRPLHYAVAFLLFLLALLTKTVTATLPAALLLVFWFERGRLLWKRDILPLLPWLAIGAGGGLFTAWMENTYIGAHGAAFSLSAAQRFLLAGRAIWFYLLKLLWPLHLIFVYPHWKIDPAVWWQYLFPAGALLLLSGLIALSSRTRGPLTSFLYFAGTLFPVLGFFNVYPFRYSWVADHFMYLASLGVIVPVAYGITVALSKPRVPRAVKGAIPVLICVLLGAMTWRQSSFYTSSENLFADTVRRNPGSSMAQNNLGVEIARTPGRQAEALSHFEAALRDDPDSAEAHENLGLALSRMPGRLPEALSHLQAAESMQPDYPESHLNLGNVLSRMPGRIPDAIREYRTALRIRPDLEEAHLNLGSALSTDPARLAEAAEQYKQTIRIDSRSAQAHYSLANVLARLPGHSEDAIAEYGAALQIEPAYLEARTNLATVLSGIPGKLSEAVREYQVALQIDPQSVDAHYDLALLLARIPGRSGEAVTELDTVLRLRPDLSQARQMLEQLKNPSRLHAE